jgi:chromate transporter
VILNLALFFGYHVLWPQGLAGSVDGAALAIALSAAVALLHYKRSVMQVIAGCGLVGLAFTLARG